MPEVLAISSMADAEPDLSTFENKTGLAEDMKFLASMPELCDVTFLVGDTREPVCAVKVTKQFSNFAETNKQNYSQNTSNRLFWRQDLVYFKKCCIRHRHLSERRNRHHVKISYDYF